MKNIISRYIEKIRKEHAVRRRVISVLLCLALVVSAGVFWNLRLTGVSMTTDVACNIEEHVHSEPCNERTVICAMEESEEHTHADECYETMLICEKDEHAHTVSCLSDETADVEIASDWEESLPTVLNGNWAENVLSVAKSQLGYTESEKNFVIDEEDNSRKGYTRYGQWYGNLYADWNTMFMAFCLNYAEVPEEAVSRTAGCYSWVAELTEAGLYKDAIDYVAEVGDIVFFDTDEDEKADKVGVVSEVTETEIITVEGDYENSVAYVTYKTENNADAGIVGVLDLNDAYLVYSETKLEELAKADEVESEVESTDEPEVDITSETVTEEPVEVIVTEETVEVAANEESFNSDNNIDEVCPTEEVKEVATIEETSDEAFELLLARFSYVQNFSDGTLPAILYEGTYGDLSWTIDENGLLKINGSGSFKDLNSYQNLAWLRYSSYIKSVEIEEGITEIGSWAFRGCTNLTNVKLPSTVTIIDWAAFYNCTSLTSIEIPDSVTSIGTSVFYGCTSLTSIEIPDSVTSIGSSAFSGCTALESIGIPDSVTSIDSSAFSGCTALKSIEIPSSITTINASTFSGCTALTSIEIPDSITTIKENAFSNCSGLKIIEIPSTVKSLDSRAFDGCSELESIIVDENNSYYTSVDGILFSKNKKTLYCYPEGKTETSYTIPNYVTSIGSYAFSYCNTLESINIPESITSIGSYAFYECDSIKELVIPDSVKYIYSAAFKSCDLLSKVKLSEGLTSIDSNLFENCVALEEVNIPSKVRNIYGSAFRNCDALTNIEIPDSVTRIGGSAFYDCDALTNVEIPDSVTSIDGSVFYSCNSLTSVKLSKNITTIPYSCFAYCYALSEIEIPEGVTIIGNSAFYGCSFESIEIPTSVTNIGDSAFSHCKQLRSIDIPVGVTSIGSHAFYNCEELLKAVIPETVTSIADYAFRSCDKLEYLEISALPAFDFNSVFGGCNAIKEVVFNGADANNLTTGTIFSMVNADLIIGDNVDVLHSDFISFATGARDIKYIGPNIINFEAGALPYTENEEPLYSLLGEIYIDENSVMYRLDKENMTASLVYVPAGFSEFTIPSFINIDLEDAIGEYKITDVESYAFGMAYDLEKLIIENPGNIESLDDYAFAECPTLTTVENGTIIPDEENGIYNTTSYASGVMSWLINLKDQGVELFKHTGLLRGYNDFSISEPNNGVASIPGSENPPYISIIPPSTYVTNNQKTVTWEDEVEGEIVTKEGVYYQFYTDESFVLTPYVSAGAHVEGREYRIYIETTKPEGITGWYPGKEDIFVNEKEGYEVPVECFDTDVPGVIYLSAKLTEGQSIAIDLLLKYNNMEVGNGGIRVWSAIVDNSKGSLTGKSIKPEESVQAFWVSETNQFDIDKEIFYWSGYDAKLIAVSPGVVKLSNNLQYKINFTKATDDVTGIGDNFIKYVDFKDTFELPTGCTWSEDTITEINKGNISFNKPYTTYLNLMVNNEKIAQFVNPRFANCDITDCNISLEGNNIVFSYRMWSDDISEEFDFGTTEATIYVDNIDVDMDKFDVKTPIKNTMSATLNYTFDEITYNTSDDDIYYLPEPSSEVKIKKSREEYKDTFGQDYFFKIQVYNDGAYNYNFYEMTGKKDVQVTDTLDPTFYISPDNMEKMLNEEYGKELTIIINNATLCTDDKHMTPVKDINGEIAYITGENSELEYKIIEELKIYWENEQIVINDGVNTYPIGENETLESVLKELNYVLIYENTSYSVEWDMTNVNNGVLLSGEYRDLNIYSTLKDTFDRGNGDYLRSYSRVYKLNYAYLHYGDEKVKSSAINYLYQYDEIYIYKEFTVNGNSIASNTATYDGDVLGYHVYISEDRGSMGDSLEMYKRYENLPIVDVMTGAQSLLIPVDVNIQNNSLADKNLRVKNVDGIDYYILSEPGEYKEIYIGANTLKSTDYLLADTISVDENTTTIKWYYSNLEWDNPDDDIYEREHIYYKAVVDTSDCESGKSYSFNNRVYANDRVKNRIYAEIPGYTVNVFDADKEIYDINNDISLGDHSFVREGEPVEYRLTLSNLINNTHTIYGNQILDVLPDTYGVFEWSKENVKLELAPGLTGVTVNDEFYNWKIVPGETEGEYVIKWPDKAEIKFDGITTAYIYVTLQFPTDNGWHRYTEKYTGTELLYNTWCVYNVEYPVSHELAVVGEVYLQKGVFDVGTANLAARYINGIEIYQSAESKGDRNYYSDSFMQENYVRYYVTICNKGKNRMYLNDIYDNIPEGFQFGGFSYYYEKAYRVYNSSNSSLSSSHWTQYVGDEDLKHMYGVVSRTMDGDDVIFSFSPASDYTQQYNRYNLGRTETDDFLKYDSDKKLCYLDPNEAISFSYFCIVDTLELDSIIAENTVSMEYVDYMGLGTKVYDMEVTNGAVDLSCEGVNDGDCRLVKGNVLESSVTQTRGEIVPGIQKSAVSYTYYNGTANVTEPYVDYARYDASVNWRIRLENKGHEPIYSYTVTDTMDYPYIFTFDSPIQMSIYDNSGRLYGKAEIPIIEAIYEGEAEINFDIEKVDANQIISTKALVSIISNENDEETLSISLSGEAVAIPNLGYIDILVSTKNRDNKYSSTTFVNEVTLTPHDQGFTDVSSGIPNVGESGSYESITTFAPINVVTAYATASLKQVEELGVEQPNIADSNGNPQKYITLADEDNIFRYTLSVMAPDLDPMNKLVFIDSLPELDDHNPFDVETKRGSEFKVSLPYDSESNSYNDNFSVSIIEKDTDGNITNTNVLDIDEYIVEYSCKTVFEAGDRNGSITEGWSTDPTLLEGEPRSFRVILEKEKVTMPILSNITVSFDAIVNDSSAEPGEIAWNNFSYYYEIVLGEGNSARSLEFEAMPLDVGVRIPSHPTIQKKVVYQEGVTPYIDDSDLEFSYLVHKGDALSNYTNVTESSFEDGQVTFVKLTVPAGESTSVVDNKLLADANCYVINNGEWIEQVDKPFVWIKDETYTVYELPHEDFKLRRLAGQKKNTYTFSYDPSVDRTFVCENSPVEWDIDLRKVDSADNSKVLSGAAFALYTKDASEGKIVPEDLATVLESTIEANGETWYFVGSGVTDEYGKLGFENLRSEVYYLYEYQAPDGYYAKARGQNIYYSDTIKSVNTVTAENVAGTALPMTGGDGTGKLVAIGLTLMAASVVMLGLKKRKMKAL